MSTLSVRLPNSLHRQLRELARDEGCSMNQIITAAVGEKLAALMTLDHLRERAGRTDRKAFERVLERVPDVEPDEEDRLPQGKRRASS